MNYEKFVNWLLALIDNKETLSAEELNEVRRQLQAVFMTRSGNPYDLPIEIIFDGKNYGEVPDTTWTK